MREQHGEASGARAKIQCRLDRRAVGDVRRETVRQDLGNERARNDDALVDVETELAEPRFARQVRGRDALVDATRQQRRDLPALGMGELRVEERLEPIERQMQRMQQQVSGLVVGAGRAVTEREPGLVEARHRIAEPVAQRFEFGWRVHSALRLRARRAFVMRGTAAQARAIGREGRGRSRRAARDRPSPRVRSACESYR